MEPIKENIPNITQEISNVGNELENRKKKLLGFLKKNGQWVYYTLLAVIVFIGTWIRTLNISKLKDITTGTWTLGPDLDPFLFLRWAKYIAENGSLFILDKLRSVPLAEICTGVQCNPVNTAGDMKLLSYMIVGVQKVLSIFGEASVTYAAIIFPVIMFALTIIAFFLFARKVFYKMEVKSRNIIALIATAFFALVPSLLPRTIAGIPEKESSAFFFIFLGFYFFLEAFTSEKIRNSLIFGVLAGISTGLLALTWGGAGYVFLTVAGAVFVAFLFGKIDTKRFCAFGMWVLSFTLMMMPFSTRYSLDRLLSSTSTGFSYILLFIIGIDFLIFKKKIFKLDEKIEKLKIKLPREIISVIISFVLVAILGSLAFGASFIPHQIQDVISQTINPLGQSRFSVTVAENKQPFFINDWRDSFGPVIFNIPLFFWLFFIGSIFLFANLIEKFEKKERIILIGAYTIFLFSLIFSRYASSGTLNGENILSKIVYIGGALVFLISFAYFYIKRYKENKLSAFKELEFSYLLYFIVLTMTIIGARGGIRLIMVLGAISPVAIGFLVYKISNDYFKQKDSMKKFLIGIIALIIIIAAVFTLWTYYKSDKATAEVFAPSAYQWQWQNAMAWVRENTPLNSVFAHWWDYGYWVQSIGERATILDGGNAVGYWNHLMGRYVLTKNGEKESMEYLYSHNATHLLIDSTEIGKYTAFSSIGSNNDYDRISWIPDFFLDDKQTVEKNDGIMYVYTGGSATDEDIVWQQDGKEIFLPKGNSYIVGIIIERGSNNRMSQPTGVYFYNNQQYNIPLRYVYISGQLNDFGSGLDAGIFIYPRLENSETGLKSNEMGASFYLSPRTIQSSIAQLYLFGQDSKYFKIAHVESNGLVKDLKNNGFYQGEFLYYQGFQGPIKIWEIKYPSDIKLNEEYLSLTYPKEFQTVDSSRY